MDRNQATGIILLTLFLMAYFYFFAPEPPVRTPEETVQSQTPESTQSTENTKPLSIADQVEDSLKNILNQQKYGQLAIASKGEEKSFTIENDLISVEISSRGGIVRKVHLKEYEDYRYEPLILLDKESSKMQYLVQTEQGEVDLTELYFSQVIDQSDIADTAVLSFALALDGNNYVKHTYLLPKDSYTLIQRSEIKGMREIIQNNQVAFKWKNDLKRLERELEDSRRNTTINYYTAAGKFDHLKETTLDLQEKSLAEPVTWVSFKQKFFTTGLIANGAFSSPNMSISGVESDTLVEKSASIAFNLPLDYFSSGNDAFTYYFGPNKFKELKKVSEGFHENLYLGWPVIKAINRHLIINVFFFLEKYIASYGLIIIILVIIVKLIISPLSYKSYLSMAKTRVLKPELDEIKEKHGDDMTKIQQEQMKLYQQVGVNPLSGCIPLLLQMPILFAMFQFIPHAVELRHQSFLWAEDLSTFDSILKLPFEIPLYGSHVSLFTLLMTITTVIMTWYNNQTTSMTMQGPMKTMQYTMPIIFMVVLNKFPAGLTFYYFISNVFSIVQQAVIRRFVDDGKIRAILEENKKKNRNKKKSKFQLKIEEALKASEEAKKDTVKKSIPKKGKK
ncbi:MAG: membrane protein insertase YidC [Cyclobacteriaceae bacterium]|nr:membrane protein insertase YidC [Cyclobacteriaceae bacterium]